MNNPIHTAHVLAAALAWAALTCGVGCGKAKPEPVPPPSKPAPTATADPRSTPEALARALHRSVAENDAIAMMHLSMLGAPTNAWIDFSGNIFKVHTGMSLPTYGSF